MAVHECGHFCFAKAFGVLVYSFQVFMAPIAALYNPQNEAFNAHKTKRAKIKTKRAKNIKRNVPTERFFNLQ